MCCETVVKGRIIMPLYEVLATISLTFAIGIPTFLEKVMRTGYETRVERYQNGVLREFREVFYDAFQEFSKSQDLTDEIENQISKVVDLWERVRSNYHKLERLIQNRTYLFLGWMLVFSSCLITLYSEYQGIQYLFNFDWAQLTNVTFVLLLLITIVYGYGLLSFDTELTKYGGKKLEEKVGRSIGTEAKVDSYEKLVKFRKENEMLVDNYLVQNNIKFEKESYIGNQKFDYVLPDRNSPKIVLTTKFFTSNKIPSGLVSSTIISEFAPLKFGNPKVKTIFITNFDFKKNTSFYVNTMKFTDVIIKIDEIDKLGEFIEKHMK